MLSPTNKIITQGRENSNLLGGEEFFLPDKTLNTSRRITFADVSNQAVWIHVTSAIINRDPRADKRHKNIRWSGQRVGHLNVF